MALDPLPSHSLSRLPSAPVGNRALAWTSAGIARGVFLFSLGMVQVWLYAWSKTEQERLDKLRTEVQNVRSESRAKAYRYAQALNGFQIKPAEEAAYQRVTPDRVDRVEVPVAAAKPVPPEVRPQRQAPSVAAALQPLVAEVRRFLDFMKHGDGTS